MLSDTKTACLHISLPQMLDLALGTSEIGIINWNILHNFLHILLHLNNFKTTKVEYRGEDAIKVKTLISSTLKLGPIINLHEYNTTDILRKNETFNSSVDNKKKDDNKLETIIGSKKNTTDEVKVDFDSVIFVEPLLKNIIPEISVFQNLEKCIQELQHQLIDNNSKKLKRIKNRNIELAINACQVLYKRPDSTANNIIRLSSVLQDFKPIDYEIHREAGGGDEADKRSIEDTQEEINNKDGVDKTDEEESEDGDGQTDQNVYKKQSDINEEDSFKMEQTEMDLLGEVNCAKLRHDIMIANITITKMREEICDLKEKLYEMSKLIEKKGDYHKKPLKHCTITPEGVPEDQYVVIKQKQNDVKPARCTDLITNVEETLMISIQNFERRFECFEEYVNCCIKNINDILAKNKNEEELIKYVEAVRCDLQDLKNDIAGLHHNQCAQEKQNDIFQEQLEFLKTLKASKEEVSEALASKADTCELNKKVSHEEFDTTCNDFARSIDEFPIKLSQQESLIQQLINELRCEFDIKIDELGIPAFKDCISNELMALKTPFKSGSGLKSDPETATARRILRNLRCVSCDKDAIMRKDPQTLNGSNGFPSRSSTKPYLTFKMNEIRNQQKKEPLKNVNNLNKILKDNPSPNKSDCGEACEYAKNQFCNRYTGGSYTIINRHQKVGRKNCIPQQPIKQEEGFITGTDQQMYKGRWVVPENNTEMKSNEGKICHDDEKNK